MKNFFLPLLILLITLSFISCVTKNDTTIKYSGFNNEKYVLLEKEDKIKYIDSILNYSQSTHNDSLDKLKYFDLSNEYYNLNDYEGSIKSSRKALRLSKLTNDTPSIGKAYSYIGDCYLVDHKDSSYYYYYQAEKLYKKLNFKEKVALMFFKKACLLMYEGNYSESEIQASKSLKLLKETKDYQLLFSAYTILGVDFEKLEEYDNALKYYFLAKDVLKILQKNEKDFDSQNDYNLLATINLSNTYQKLGDYQKAIEQLSSIINDTVKLKWPKDYAIILGDLGNAKMQSGNLKNVQKLFLDALEISRNKNFEDNIVYEYINLGEYYLKVQDFTKSKYYLKEALRLAKKINATDEIKTALKLLVKVDSPNSYYYHERYISITDSLVKAQRISRDKYARIEYETSVVVDENRYLTLQNLRLLIGSIFVFFGLIGVIIYRYIKSQKRELSYRIQQQKAEEELFELLKDHQIKLSDAKELEQNRISKELHDGVMNKLYGARMQLGILNDSDAKEVKQKRLQYVDLLQEIEQDIRTISHDLKTDFEASSFEYVSLLENLVTLQEGIGSTDFTLVIDATIDWECIDSRIKITIYRIVQEGILNVVKHAKAKKCTISIHLESERGVLILKIHDNGVGFDNNVSFATGIGLNNINERVKMIKALLDINSTLNEGTTVLVKVDIRS